MNIKEHLKKYWWLVGIVILSYGYLVFVDWSYESKIGSYMNNAYDVNTPEKMLEQLNLAKSAMIKQGLTENMYGAIIFKKPDNQMSFQYKHLDSIIERVKAVDTWYKATYKSESMGTETLGDVYEQKMTNLRNFIMEEVRSDWIARNTWYIHHHPTAYLFKFCDASVSKGVSSGGLFGIPITIIAILFAYYFFTKRKGGNLEEDEIRDFLKKDKPKNVKPNRRK